jgi:ribosomal protein S18 acetylase RimI-like enzyme
MDYRIEIVREKNQLLLGYNLVKTLTPSLTFDVYSQYLNEMLDLGYFQVQVFYKNELIGLSGVWLGTKIYCGRYLEMDNVVVAEQFRSAGIGQLLCDKVEQLAKAHSCKVIMLDAYLENTRAHEFYERKDFIKRGYHFIKKLE